jgi:hypothetical protein
MLLLNSCYRDYECECDYSFVTQDGEIIDEFVTFSINREKFEEAEETCTKTLFTFPMIHMFNHVNYTKYNILII